MLNANAFISSRSSGDAIVVRAPGAADILRCALSAAFERDDRLPEDWCAMLARLDQLPPGEERV